MTDRLAWWEEIPLGLALLAQSYVVGLWYFASISGAAWQADLFVAVGAGLALDLIVVTTVMGRRQGRSSGWSWATSFGAFGCSSLIALDRYSWEWRSLLHVAFPLVVFLYSQHLATPRKTALQTLPERLEATIGPVADTEATPASVAQNQAVLETLLSAPLGNVTPLRQPQATQAVLEVPLFDTLEDFQADLIRRMKEAEFPDVPLDDIQVVQTIRYTCPHCGRPLASKQARGAAVKNGYCLGCKEERKAG